jgi:hypothetical protein
MKDAMRNMKWTVHTMKSDSNRYSSRQTSLASYRKMDFSDTIFTAECVKCSILFYGSLANVGEFAVPENARTITNLSAATRSDLTVVSHSSNQKKIKSKNLVKKPKLHSNVHTQPAT